MSSKQQVSEKDWKFLQRVTVVNLILISTVIILSFLVPDAEATYHHVAVVGDFHGKYDHKSINALGDYRISNDEHTFTLTGDFVKDGRDMTYNINCITIIGQLVLESQETNIYLDFDGKECQYGYMSYVFGTFSTTDSTGKFEGIIGDGRVSFYTNHYSDNVSGTLQGKFRL
ncbi:MAG: hypothetical protein KJI69_03940 [Patescibacteria group bacterium]|nr:hypothetical protein [Patescibacteria group bacterium]